jgi:hypothetical protein
MSNQEPLPSKEGLREVQELFRQLRKKEPTPELVKIIEEVTNLPKSKEKRNNNTDGIAAKEA